LRERQNQTDKRNANKQALLHAQCL